MNTDRKTLKRGESYTLGRALTDKQKKWADLVILLDKSGTEAALECGYNFTGNKNDKARRMANYNFNNSNIKKYMNALREEIKNSLLIDELYLLKRYKKLAEDADSDNTKLRALDSLAKVVLGNSDEQAKINIDAGAIVRGFYEDRIKEDSKNVVSFKKANGDG